MDSAEDGKYFDADVKKKPTCLSVWIFSQTPYKYLCVQRITIYYCYYYYLMLRIYYYYLMSETCLRNSSPDSPQNVYVLILPLPIM